MSMPTSIFSFLPSTSIGSTLISSLPPLPGIPSGAIDALKGGVGSLLSSLGGPPGAGGGNSSQDNSSTPLTNFLTDITRDGVAWPNRFYVRISPPRSMLDVIASAPVPGRESIADNLTLSHLMMRCDMAEIPGYTYTTSESHYMGPTFKAPSNVVYSDLNLNFIVSADLVEKYFFDYWFLLIRDDSYLFSYFDDIVADIEVTLYTAQNEPVYGVIFKQAWPMAVNPLQLSWQDQEYMRFAVTFTYHHWEPQGYPPPQYSSVIAPPDAQSSGLLQVAPPNAQSSGLLQDLFFSVLPSIPGGQKLVGIASMNARDMMRAGVSLAGNRLMGKDPITNTLLSAGSASLNKLIGGGF